MPALPLDEAGKYVAGAYVLFVALLLIYLAIMSARLSRIDRELGELADLAEGNGGRGSDRAAEPAATSEPQLAGTGREAEDLGGGLTEHSGGDEGSGRGAEHPGGGVTEHSGGGVRNA